MKLIHNRNSQCKSAAETILHWNECIIIFTWNTNHRRLTNVCCSLFSEILNSQQAYHMPSARVKLIRSFSFRFAVYTVSLWKRCGFLSAVFSVLEIHYTAFLGIRVEMTVYCLLFTLFNSLCWYLRRWIFATCDILYINSACKHTSFCDWIQRIMRFK